MFFLAKKKPIRKPAFVLGLFFLITTCEAFAQDTIPKISFWETPNLPIKTRVNAVTYTTLGTATLGLAGLYQLWYAGYDGGSFRFFDDSQEWMLMDKVGHTFSAYQLGRASTSMFRWTGMPRKKAAWVGGLSGYAFLTTIEIFDGFSEGWGFSWADVAANTIGMGLVVGQELLLEEQVVQLKFSFAPTEWPQYRPSLLGKSLTEQLLKDYNGQTYWLSGNWVKKNNHNGVWPQWLNVALGYSADGMLGAIGNPKGLGVSPMRTRSFLFSLDIDLTRIKTRHRGLKTLFFAVNALKIPAPSLRYQNDGSWHWHWLYF